MKIKVALGVIVSLTAITLNTMPTENDTKMRIGNEIICKTETDAITKIENKIEMTDSEIVIQDIPKTENSSKQPKIPAENVSANEVPKKKDYIENEPKNANPDSNSPQGKAYVEGFGYVEIGGPTQVITGYSDGDINKMVGTWTDQKVLTSTKRCESFFDGCIQNRECIPKIIFNQFLEHF